MKRTGAGSNFVEIEPKNRGKKKKTTDSTTGPCALVDDQWMAIVLPNELWTEYVLPRLDLHEKAALWKSCKHFLTSLVETGRKFHLYSSASTVVEALERAFDLDDPEVYLWCQDRLKDKEVPLEPWEGFFYVEYMCPFERMLKYEKIALLDAIYKNDLSIKACCRYYPFHPTAPRCRARCYQASLFDRPFFAGLERQDLDAVEITVDNDQKIPLREDFHFRRHEGKKTKSEALILALDCKAPKSLEWLLKETRIEVDEEFWWRLKGIDFYTNEWEIGGCSLVNLLINTNRITPVTCLELIQHLKSDETYLQHGIMELSIKSMKTPDSSPDIAREVEDLQQRLTCLYKTLEILKQYSSKNPINEYSDDGADGDDLPGHDDIPERDDNA